MTFTKNSLEIYTYEYLLQEALARIPDTVDKREGSVIYDALAPACYLLAGQYMDLAKVFDQTYILSATGENLDKRVAEQGITREAETFATKLGRFTSINGTPMYINLGSRFQTIGAGEVLNYTATEVYTDQNGQTVAGQYRLVCETAGTVGNSYVGELLPISYINGLEKAEIVSTLIPAQDIETDEKLRERYLQKVNTRPFGGNVAQYDEEVRALDGVGEAQIYPTWDGAGTVLISIVDAEYNAVSNEFVQFVGETLDPHGYNGNGLGIAPIGAIVTVTTPTEVLLNIAADIRLDGGVTLPQVEQPINESIANYIEELKAQWGIADNRNNYGITVYIAKLMSSILMVSGVSNVANVTINGSPDDLPLTQTAIEQQLPKQGTVTLNVV